MFYEKWLFRLLNDLKLKFLNFFAYQVVIGCDGVNSTVAKFLGMKSTRLFSTCVVRGFTRYPSGHKFHNAFIVLSKGNVQLGRMSVNGKLVYWFVTRLDSSRFNGIK
ncbi:Monooxygenase 1 [Camellia lanceoleosa]|uniref:Monooxygenase 1 n=1 Tax=Camellia lanceoleosa TaxID=1840588 RepID=A0ACC0IA62_9ERIC|nr:Monooxygenase 1 [Camellia lanceoleosa]